MFSSLTLAPAETIDEVIARLDGVIEQSIRDGSRLGLFACLYRSVTARVRDGIQTNRFEDGPRMERFDVVFANRYLSALAAYRRGEHPGRSWLIAFEGTLERRLLIVQHLLLGMNAHINLDLGASAAQIAPGAALVGLKKDFFEISRLLKEMIEEVQTKISRVSPWMGVLDAVGCRTDEEVFYFGLSRARDAAWSAAICLATTPASRLSAELDRVDRATAFLGYRIRTPGVHLLPALLAVRAREVNDLRTVLEVLG